MLERLRRRAGAGEAGTAADDVLERAAGLRPAQAGVVLAGIVKPPHIAATLIHLAIRGHLMITDEGGSAEPDWLLILPVRSRAASGLPLAGFEKTLLHGFFRHRPARRLSEFRHVFSAQQAISAASSQLLHGAVFSGALAPLDSAGAPDAIDSGPDGGDSTHAQVRAFRNYLAGLPPGDAGQGAAFSRYLPYAVAFGFGDEWARQGGQPEHAHDGHPWYRQLPALTTALTGLAEAALPTSRHLGDDEPYGPSDTLDGMTPESPFRGYQS